MLIYISLIPNQYKYDTYKNFPKKGKSVSRDTDCELEYVGYDYTEFYWCTHEYRCMK